ncbi:MAG: hypothetical protein M3P26_10705 [Gemmatimonadota bacterium]|nr:hypothetical protein [Gemmatimonadota bacterium]
MLDLPPSVTIDWRSPREDDEYAEYRDADFLSVVGLDRLRPDLQAFWPDRGPQWDALGVASDGKVVLVEAKAHAREMASTCAAGSGSLELIVRALDAAKRHYSAPADRDWLRGYYQYANRLAHLQFLRDRNVDAHLVFVYFLGDTDMRGPDSKEAWAGAIDDCHTALGIAGERPQSVIHDVFVRGA